MVELIFERGVFRPTQPVQLPEGTRLRVELPSPVSAETDEELDRQIHEVLSRRFQSGHTDTAARHNEHLP